MSMDQMAVFLNEMCYVFECVLKDALQHVHVHFNI